MLRLVAFMMAFSFITTANAQNDTARTLPKNSDHLLLQNLLKSMQNYENQFSCIKRDTVIEGKTKSIYPKFISDKAFQKLFDKTTNRILGVSTEVANNGTGATLEFNEALKKITISHTWERKEIGRINTFGFEAEDASKKVFEIFGKNGWKDGFKFTFGQLIPSSRKTIYFESDDCLKHKQSRGRYALRILQEYQDALRLTTDEVTNMNATMATNRQMSISNIKDYRSVPNTPSEYQIKLLRQRNAIDSLIGNNDVNAYIKLFKDSIDNFDIVNANNLGYHQRWLSWSVSAGLARFNVFDTAVIRIAEVKKESLPRISAQLSWNQFQETPNGRILFYSLQGSIGNTNYLEEILPSEIAYLKTIDPVDQIEIKESFDVLIIDDYDQLKKMYGLISIGATGVWYPPNILRMGRFIGFEGSASAKLKILEGNDVPARDLFNAHAGLLFTFEKEKIAKTTVAVLARLSNVPFDSFIPKKYFNVGIRIGVPFGY